MLRNRKTTGVTVIGSSSFMLSDNLKVRESLGVISFDSNVTPTLPVDTKATKTETVIPQPMKNQSPQKKQILSPSQSGNIDTMNSIDTSLIITEQPLVTDVDSLPQEYPVDLNGFLNGLSEGLSNIVRDVKTSRFAADVKMDAKSIWKSTKGAVTRLVIEPLKSMEEEEMEAEARRQKEYDRADAATKVRMPSAWGTSSGQDDSSLSHDQSSFTGMSNDKGKRRKSREMGATKLAKTPKKSNKKSSSSSSTAEPSEDNAKAELGSAIDLRKLSKAKKVQVFQGPGTAIMVVGARRLVVIEARPTEKQPHQGVVIWMSTLENVLSIALEIQPAVSSNEDLSVALKVEVKKGEDYVFLMGYKDSTAVVQSIYARLNGETPPSLPPPQSKRPPNHHPESDSIANEAACLAACSKADGSSSSSQGMPQTPTDKSSSRRMKSSHKKHHRSHHKKRSKDAENISRICKENTNQHTSSSSSGGGGGGEFAVPASPTANTRGDGSETSYSSPLNGKGRPAEMLSPLRIMLSPTGKGKNMSLEVTSISSPRGTLSLGPLTARDRSSHHDHSNVSLSTMMPPIMHEEKVSPLKSTAICFDSVLVNNDVDALKEEKKIKQVEVEDPMPLKFRLMLKNGVPEQAVRNKLKNELNITDDEVEVMFNEHQRAVESSEEAAKKTSSHLNNESESPSALSSSIEKESDVLSKEEMQQCAKYKLMLKAGVPEIGVIDKMKKDEISNHLIKFICPTYDFVPSSCPKDGKEEEEEVKMTTEEDKQTRKYRAMLKAGVPKEGVRHKMIKDGIEERLICLMFNEPYDHKNKKNNKDNEVETLTLEEEGKIAKFKAMLKAGVPMIAVRHKMIKELGNENQRLINAVCGKDDGSDSLNNEGTEKWKGRNGDNDENDDKLKTAKKPKNTSKLLTLHWTPLGISEEQFESSMWAQATPLVKKKNNNNDDDLNETSQRNGQSRSAVVLSPEMQRLELLFSKKPTKSLQKEGGGGSSSDGTLMGGPKKMKKKITSCLDNTRRQNLSIGLRSFKDISSPNSIGHYVSCLDVNKFTAEQLTRLEEMLPTDAEIKSVERHVKDMEKDLEKERKSNPQSNESAPSSHKSAIEMLEPAESFVIGFANIERAKAKLSILTFMRTLEPQVKELLLNFNTLGSACEQVTTSPSRLTSLLLEVLAVGNIMNEGTEKGGAKGITVDSLLKLTNTRSVCKSMTVLDYIVDSLLVKQRKYISEKVPTIEDLLDGPSSSSSSFHKSHHADEEEEEEDGPASILDFAKDLPDLNEACRLPLGELIQQVTQIGKSLAMAKREHQKLKNENDKMIEKQNNSSSEEIGKTRSQTNSLKAADTSSSSSSSSLMEMLKQRAIERDEQPSREPVTDRNDDSRRDVPLGRNLSESMQDEAEACQSTKTMSDENGLRASSFLASDPKAGFLAALKARAVSEEPESTSTTSSTSITTSTSTTNSASISSTSSALKALDDFMECAEMCLKQVQDSSEECRIKCENVTKFFGEPGTDVGHILKCLKQFSVVTIESKDKAINKKLEEERKERIAAKQEASAMTPFKSGNQIMTTPSRDIDPKAGLMSEIRQSKDARLERSLMNDSIVE